MRGPIFAAGGGQTPGGADRDSQSAEMASEAKCTRLGQRQAVFGERVYTTDAYLILWFWR